jgi:hypothetical protein
MLGAQPARTERPGPPPSALKAGFDAAMAFSPERARSLWQTREALAAFANEEVAFRVISVDAQNLTAGTRLHVLEPARAVLAEWRQARAPFDGALEPFMGAINALRDLERDIAKLEQEKQQALGQAEHKLQQDQAYVRVAERHRSTRIRFDELRAAHGNLDANMGAFNPLYWVALLAIGGAEWLINYNVFYMFMGIPALAAGATIILGVLLAFAAHGHGSLLKQWSHRFGAERRSIERHGDWRLLALSTFSLAVVLLAAGGSRYAAVISTMAGQVTDNLAGADAIVQTHPLRDVLLSLLANVAAWAVGVFIAYLAHDVDPDYMRATRQEHLWSRRYNRMRAPTEDEQRTIEAQFEKRVRELKATAARQAAGVRDQQELLAQVAKHEQAVVAAVAAQVATNAGAYHDVLAQLVISMQGECRIRQGEEDMSPYAFKALRPLVSADDLRAMVA